MAYTAPPTPEGFSRDVTMNSWRCDRCGSHYMLNGPHSLTAPSGDLVAPEDISDGCLYCGPHVVGERFVKLEGTGAGWPEWIEVRGFKKQAPHTEGLYWVTDDPDVDPTLWMATWTHDHYRPETLEERAARLREGTAPSESWFEANDEGAECERCGTLYPWWSGSSALAKDIDGDLVRLAPVEDGLVGCGTLPVTERCLYCADAAVGRVFVHVRGGLAGHPALPVVSWNPVTDVYTCDLNGKNYYIGDDQLHLWYRPETLEERTTRLRKETHAPECRCEEFCGGHDMPESSQPFGGLIRTHAPAAVWKFDEESGDLAARVARYGAPPVKAPASALIPSTTCPEEDVADVAKVIEDGLRGIAKDMVRRAFVKVLRNLGLVELADDVEEPKPPRENVTVVVDTGDAARGIKGATDALKKFGETVRELTGDDPEVFESAATNEKPDDDGAAATQTKMVRDDEWTVAADHSEQLRAKVEEMERRLAGQERPGVAVQPDHPEDWWPQED